MKKKLLITGGAGFIGINSADHFLTKGYDVALLDNMSRIGTPENLKWLKGKWGSKFSFVKADIVTDEKKLQKAVQGVDAVLHLAAQVAVTFSVKDPVNDFLVNARGTLNVLEAVRNSKKKPLVVFASTNKVHGSLEDLKVKLTSDGYRYVDFPHGVADTHPLDFHSPYGCSKGSADQYVRDYSRIFGIPTVVFRQSCIYGPHQFGMEDQGWVAWFVIRTLLGYRATIFGTGQQTRDVLHVNDLCRLYELAIENPTKVSGQVYSVGGGSTNVSSVLGAIAAIEKGTGKKLNYTFADWRPGDQKVYISDVRKATKLGWRPQITFKEGLKDLVTWAQQEEKLLKEYIPA